VLLPALVSDVLELDLVGDVIELDLEDRHIDVHPDPEAEQALAELLRLLRAG